MDKILTPMAYLLMGAKKRAADHIKELLDASEDPRLYSLRAKINFEDGEYQTAWADLSTYIEKEKEDSLRLYGYLDRARVHAALQQYQAAREDLRRAVELAESCDRDETLLEELRPRREMIEEMIEEQAQQAPMQTPTPLPILEDALDAIVAGDFEQGLAIADTLCKQRPVVRDAFFVRGYANDLMGRQASKSTDFEAAKAFFSKAIEDYTDAIEGDSSFAIKAQFKRALLRMSLHEDEEAFKDLSAVVKSEPENMSARLFRGRAALKYQQNSEAELDIDYILEREPENEQAWGLKGELELWDVRYDEALECFEKALRHTDTKKDVTRTRFLIYKTFTLYLKKEYQEAFRFMLDVQSSVVRLPDDQRLTLRPQMEKLRQHLEAEKEKEGPDPPPEEKKIMEFKHQVETRIYKITEYIMEENIAA